MTINRNTNSNSQLPNQLTLGETEKDNESVAVFQPPRERFLSVLGTVSTNQSIGFGLVGVILFFSIWEIGHLLTPELQQKFLPGVVEVVGKIAQLIRDKGFIGDIGKSLYRIYVSFFVACMVAIPLGLLMGCFIKLRALINPMVGGLRYLPAASFVPLLLVYLGPTDSAKMALLFLGCVFFLIALILDNVLAVPRELIESAQTMGANRRHIVFRVTLPAAAPQIVDSMRNMIAVSWTYLVIAEIVAATDGIGAVMMRGAKFLHIDIIMAGILTIGILGVLTDMLFRFTRRLLFPYLYARR
jgi:NitT/TauT family transport system permease protein|tara:strand:- start:1499 stop:2398 length:900 start_codon:yes stop_codon:yes gene_type:complete